jgi:hypothetical protein
LKVEDGHLQMAMRRTSSSGDLKVKLASVLLAAALLALPQLSFAQSSDIFAIDYIQQNLKKGITTPADVIRAFGDPHSRDSRISSEGGSQETFVYIKNGAKPKKSGRSLGALLGVARGVVGDVASATGNYNREADRALGGAGKIADRVSSTVPAAQEQKQVTLTISFSGGVLSNFEMR